MSALWIGLVVAALLLIALLIFIAQNSKQVANHYLGIDGHISLAVAPLLAAVLRRVARVANPRHARIIQLRRALKRNATAASAKPCRARRSRVSYDDWRWTSIGTGWRS